MTDHDKAIEAAARALFVKELGGDEGFSKWEPLLAEYRSQATTAITAYLAALGEAGYVVVPVEATEGMIDAAEGMRPYREEGERDGDYDANTEMTWNAMLAARPRIAEAKE